MKKKTERPQEAPLPFKRQLVEQEQIVRILLEREIGHFASANSAFHNWAGPMDQHMLPRADLKKVYPELGTWESTLSSEFRTVTPTAMVHFRAIKKIIGQAEAIRAQGSTFRLGKIRPGDGQTKQGLKLYCTNCMPQKLYTPWGTLKFRLIWEPSFWYDLNSALLRFAAARLEEDGCNEEWCFQYYKIVAVNGETLPTPIDNKLGGLGLFSIPQWQPGEQRFVPKVWIDMEKKYQTTAQS